MGELKEIREKILENLKEVVEQNKELVKDAYNRVIKLERIARREGLLALEYEAEFMPRETRLCNELVEMIDLIVSGTDPKFFDELMTIKFFATYNYTGIDAVLYYLYGRSMLMIQAGMSPKYIEDLFNAVLPEEVLNFKQERMRAEEAEKEKIVEWKSAFTDAEKDLLNKIENRLNDLSEEDWKIIVSSRGFFGLEKVLPYMDENIKNKAKNYINDYRYYVIMGSPSRLNEQDLLESNDELEKVINRMCGKTEIESVLDFIQKCNDEEIQLLLRHVDNNDLTVALKGAGPKTADCFFRNMSSRLKTMIQEDMEYMGAVRMCDMEKSEEYIVGVARKVLDWETVQS